MWGEMAAGEKLKRKIKGEKIVSVELSL